VAKEVPRLLGRQEAELEKPMRKLQELGIVFSKKRADGEMVCELNVQSKLMEPLKKFWAYNEQQENRLKILTYLLSRKIR
jgi:hypothetical protein